MEKIRNIKFVFDSFTPEFDQYVETYFKCFHEINHRFLELIQKGYTFEQRFKGYYCIEPDGTILTDAKCCSKYFIDIYDKYITRKAKAYFNGMYNLVARQYQGYMKRNSTPTKCIHLKEKTIALKNGDMQLIDGKIVVKNIFGEDFILGEHKQLGCLKNVKYLPAKFGGNIVLKQECLIVKVNIPYSFAYKPAKIVGIDINRKNSNWIYLSTPNSLIAKPKHIIQLEECITLINKQIKDKNLNTKQRKRRRLRWRRLHKKHKRAVEQIVDGIINDAIQNKWLLAIDTVATGQSNGTFGQDKLIAMLTTKCENQGIPFVVTPCAYTSQRCVKCGYISKKNRKEDSFECKNCGFKIHADYNGSINLAVYAQYLARNQMFGIVDRYAAIKRLAGEFNFPSK